MILGLLGASPKPLIPNPLPSSFSKLWVPSRFLSVSRPLLLPCGGMQWRLQKSEIRLQNKDDSKGTYVLTNPQLTVMCGQWTAAATRLLWHACRGLGLRA